jgi:UDP-N-acetylmuramoyl-tripeptide--D-alanyl-D-alanine ligase
MGLFYLLLIFFSLCAAVAWSAVRIIRSLHLLQLDSYSNARLWKWLWVAPFQRFFEYRSLLILSVLLTASLVLGALGFSGGAFLLLGIWPAAAFFLWRKSKTAPAKKKLVYTGRAIRILFSALTIWAILAALAGVYGGWSLPDSPSSHLPLVPAFILFAGLFLTQLAPLSVVAANALLIPVQSAINGSYLRAAKRRLRDYAPTVIGITGSYGKTSVKFLLHTLLSERFRALKTPESYNTLMGVCRVINEQLRPDHEVFIAEMGAYRPGDIKELCDLVHPRMGILTAIGPQHLERFKTLENIEAAKYELIEALPPSGVAVFNNDDPRCRKLADRTAGLKVLRYGLDGPPSGLRVWAEGVTQNAEGLSFILKDSDGHSVPAKIGVLGRHNISNLLAAACVALEMGCSLEEIAHAFPKVRPVPHRLEPTRGAGGVTVIDDSYNSNPVGAMEALKVLAEFKSGRRVLVTPGMVELGAMEAQKNEDLGAAAAKTCDYVVLVGPQQTRAILRGLEKEGFTGEKIRVVKGLQEATAELRTILRPGDVVLFENDLPDLYLEGK